MNQHTMSRRKRLKALLAKLQKQTEWSASKLAQKMDVSKQTFSNWVNCRVDPDTAHLETIAKFANLSLNDLIAYLENKPLPPEEIKLETLLREIKSLPVAEAIKVAEEAVNRVQVSLNTLRHTQEAIIDNQNVQNELVQIVRARLAVLGEEEFLKISELTKAELDSVLEGERPNSVILVLIDRVLPELSFSKLCDLVDNIYGDLKPPAMPWLAFLSATESPTD